MNKRIVFLLLVYTLAASHNATRLVGLVERMKFILLEKIDLSEKEKEEISNKNSILDDFKFILLILVIVFTPIVNVTFVPIMCIISKLSDIQLKSYIEETLDKIK